MALLVLGLALIAGIYVWHVWGSRRGLGLRRNRFLKGNWRRKDPDGVEAPARMSREVNDDVDYGATLDDLSGVLQEARGGSRPSAGAHLIEEAARKSRKDRALPKAAGEERVLVLYLSAPAGLSYTGTAIRSAAEGMGMRFGEMGVFHHFGIGAMQSKTSLFCLASMFEPGGFDPEGFATFQTAGLALFMRLPLPVDGAVAFELMLNTAQRLAQRLGGELHDDRHDRLGAEQIERLRRQAADAWP